ncbi:hypothetical protein HPP92_005854 [Vanilla planifolia]|uniref:Secreted protein n=1 Tax=Vanilla planifolia TaxID=51239 RepID=A0A835RHY1_VANPL|nr:hypothetical protein HPP92_005854 [Vanilla planifolia]
MHIFSPLLGVTGFHLAILQFVSARGSAANEARHQESPSSQPALTQLGVISLLLRLSTLRRRRTNVESAVADSSASINAFSVGISY